MRKIATLLAAATSTVMLAAGSSAVSPSPAEAAVCKWKMPSSATFVQSNNHKVSLQYNRASGSWTAKAYNKSVYRTGSSEVAFTSFTPRLVKFIITWYDETAGVYTGSIDSDGFVSGTARDRFNPGSKASFYMTTRARCA